MLDTVTPKVPKLVTPPTCPKHYVRLAPRPAKGSCSSFDEDSGNVDEKVRRLDESSGSSLEQEGRAIPVLAHRRAPVAVECTREDQLMMYFFRAQGSRSLGGAFDEGFWTGDLLRATVSHPIIWHSCASLAAFHWRANANQDALQLSNALRRVEIVGMTQYGKALQCAADLAAKPSLRADEKQVLLMANLVLTGINFLLGRPTEAMIHLGKGVELFHVWHIIEQAFDDSSSDDLLPMNSLTTLANRFFTQTYTYRDRSWPNIVSNGRRLVQDVTPFQSLTEAYFSLEEIYNRQCFTWREEVAAAARSEPSPRPDVAYRARMEFKQWEKRFVEIEAHHSTLDNDDEEAILILRMRSKMMEMTLSQDYSMSELAYDGFTTCFGTVLDLAEAIIVHRSKTRDVTHRFSFSASVCEPLALIIAKCRHSATRRRGLELLRRANLREGVYDSNETLGLVSLMVVEEEAQLARPKDPEDVKCNCIQHIFLCNDHRIAEAVAAHDEDGRVSTVMRTVRDFRLGRPGVVIELPGG